MAKSASNPNPSSPSPGDRAARAAAILTLLKREYPDTRCSLDYASPLELLVATILAAQCTDERVNQATPTLFARYRTARDYADADPAELEGALGSLSMYRNKAKALKKMGQQLVERHGGEVPAEMDALTALAGAGRKTANVVLGVAFGMNEGVCVDTHCGRVSQRLGLTTWADPVKIERDLMEAVPREEWCRWTHLLIDHGRAVCTARSPRCRACVLRPHCPSGDSFLADGTAGE